MLENCLLPQLQQDMDRDFIFQQDGVALTFHCEVTSYLNCTVVAWIGRGGTIAWPPWSPDLTSLDSPVWGYVKEKIIVPPLPSSLEELWARIIEAAATTDADMIHRRGTKSLTRWDICHDMRKPYWIPVNTYRQYLKTYTEFCGIRVYHNTVTFLLYALLDL